MYVCGCERIEKWRVVNSPKNALEGDNIFSKPKIEDKIQDKMHNYL